MLRSRGVSRETGSPGRISAADALRRADSPVTHRRGGRGPLPSNPQTGGGRSHPSPRSAAPGELGTDQHRGVLLDTSARERATEAQPRSPSGTRRRMGKPSEKLPFPKVGGRSPPNAKRPPRPVSQLSSWLTGPGNLDRTCEPTRRARGTTSTGLWLHLLVARGDPPRWMTDELEAAVRRT